MVKWWDRGWGALWVVGSAIIAFKTARWFAVNASPADLGPLRYGLIVFAFLFGMLVGMAVLSLAIIGVMVAFERLFAAIGRPLKRPALADSGLRIAAARGGSGDRRPEDPGTVEARPVAGNTAD